MMPNTAAVLWVNDGLDPLSVVVSAWLAGLPLEWVLFVNNPTLTIASDFSALVEATFPGYARVSASGWAPMPGNDGGFLIEANTPLWTLSTTLGSPIGVIGFALVKPGPDTLYYAGKFDSPFLLQNAGNTVTFDPAFLLANCLLQI